MGYLRDMLDKAIQSVENKQNKPKFIDQGLALHIIPAKHNTFFGDKKLISLDDTADNIMSLIEKNPSIEFCFSD